MTFTWNDWTHVELRAPLGAISIVPFAVYLAMTAAQLAGTRARLLGRVEAIRARARGRS